MSELLTTYAGHKVKDILAAPLRDMLKELIADADYVMGASLDDGEAVKMIRWLIEHLYEKYGYLPFNHIRAAIHSGSLGQRGGTSKLIARNVIIWISEQDKIFQEQNAANHRRLDEEKRNTAFVGTAVNQLFGSAVMLKIRWKCDGRISSQEYDRVSSQKIYDLLKAGRKPDEIRIQEVML